MNLYAKKQNFLVRKILVTTVVLVAGIIFLNIFQSQTRNSFFYVSAPLSKPLMSAGKSTAKFFGGLLSFTALNNENSNLKNENQHLLASLVSLQEAFNASRDLKIALENTASEPYQVLQAGIVGLDVEHDTMLIDKGFFHGIKENMPVISKEKVLFGKVVKVYGEFSQIMLISSEKSALAVKIQTWPTVEVPVHGVVKGNGNLGVYMDLITSDSIINEGDTLVTSAREGIFPKELLVGKVTGVVTSDSKAFQTAEIAPLFDPKKTDNVFVIIDYLKK